MKTVQVSALKVNYSKDPGYFYFGGRSYDWRELAIFQDIMTRLTIQPIIAIQDAHAILAFLKVDVPEYLCDWMLEIPDQLICVRVKDGSHDLSFVFRT